jgi:hypothetical protein
MSDYRQHGENLGNAALKTIPGLAGVGASATFLGLGADQWALIASVATAIYVIIQIVLCLPKLIILARRVVRYFRPEPDDSDEAGADQP